MSTEAETLAESHPFQAEVAELLRLMVHAVYSETDVFLRELISNASDACDRLRYEAIAKPELLAAGGALAIRIRPDAAAGTLTVEDNGIGMDRQELIDNLGTIARSGTRAFLSRLAEAKDGAGLIGQFGVGFYAAFMVADRIEVTSRRAGAGEAWVWTSTGGGGFTVAPADEAAAAAVPRGTKIVLHLKPDAKRYLEPHEIERIVRTYSEHISFPIELAGEGEPRQINTASAPWQRAKSELKPEDYKEAYRAVTGGFDEPAMTLHYRAEGRQSYAVLLFVPSTAPYDLFDPDRKGRVKLYVRRVYITDDAGLLPAYLRFVRGVVDSEDLPLNISREMLQNNPQAAQIRKALTGRIIGELENLAGKEPGDGGRGQRRRARHARRRRRRAGRRLRQDLAGLRPRSQGRDLRGPRAAGPIAGACALYHDRGRDALAQRLCRRSQAEPDGNLLPGRRQHRAAEIQPQARSGARPRHRSAAPDRSGRCLLDRGAARFRRQAPQIAEPGRGRFWPGAAASRAATNAAEAKTEQPPEVDEAAVIAAVKTALGDRVADVRASRRLTDSAACLVAGGHGPDRELERLLARHSRGAGIKPILELNMRHALVAALFRAAQQARDPDVRDLAALLFDEAQILDGELPDDPAAFMARLNRFILRGLPAAG